MVCKVLNILGTESMVILDQGDLTRLELSLLGEGEKIIMNKSLQKFIHELYK